MAGAVVGGTGDELAGAEVGSSAVAGVLVGAAVVCISVCVGSGALVAGSVLASRGVSVSPDVAVAALSAPSATVSVVDGAQDANVKASTRPPRRNHIVLIERHNLPLGSRQIYTRTQRIGKHGLWSEVRS